MCGNDPAVGLLLLQKKRDARPKRSFYSNQTLRKSLTYYGKQRNQSFSRLHDKSLLLKEIGKLWYWFRGLRGKGRKGHEIRAIETNGGIIGIIEKQPCKLQNATSCKKLSNCRNSYFEKNNQRSRKCFDFQKNTINKNYIQYLKKSVKTEITKIHFISCWCRPNTHLIIL